MTNIREYLDLPWLERLSLRFVLWENLVYYFM